MERDTPEAAMIWTYHNFIREVRGREVPVLEWEFAATKKRLGSFATIGQITLMGLTGEWPIASPRTATLTASPRPRRPRCGSSARSRSRQ